MKAASVLFLLTLLAGSSATGQGWTTELGIGGGVLRQKPAGTDQSDQIDRWELPSSGAIQPSLYLVVPLRNRVAVEFGVAASHTKFREASGLIPPSSTGDTRATVRADFALTTRAYVAAGGLVRYRQINDAHSTQTGAVAALGYLLPIGSRLTARIEGQWLTQRKTDSIAPSNVYALLFGVSRRLTSARSTAAGSSDKPRPYTPWRLQLGVAGGYIRNHLYGTVSGIYVDAREDVIYLPGSGATTPAPLFLDAPLRGRLAVEIGFAAHRTQQSGTTVFDGHLAPRINVAIYGGLYAAAGGNFRYIERTGSKGFAFSGATVAAGYRVRLIDALEVRVDLGYTAFKERTNFPLAQNTVAALVGVAVALR